MPFILSIIIFSGSPTLSLADAVAQARAHQPQLAQARATTLAAEARVDEGAAGLWPQLSGNAAYQRSTHNFVPRPGSVPQSFNVAAPSTFSTSDFWSFGLSVNQLVYDF